MPALADFHAHLSQLLAIHSAGPPITVDSECSLNPLLPVYCSRNRALYEIPRSRAWRFRGTILDSDGRTRILMWWHPVVDHLPAVRIRLLRCPPETAELILEFLLRHCPGDVHLPEAQDRH